MRSLLYVSTSLLTLPEGLEELAEFVETSRARNADLMVTGALIFTERHFAQWLEGPRAAIDDLMIVISRDSRQKDVRVVKVVDDVPRRFASWSLAYWGTATFVDRLIASVQSSAPAADDHALNVHRLEDAIYQFALRGGGRTLGR
jgi:hypothetical protein